MKIVYYINKLLILATILLGAYIYTTYFGFLGLGSGEMEKFLVIPIIVVPILIFTFIVNKLLNKKLHLKKQEVWFPIYSVLAFMLPIFFIDSRVPYIFELLIMTIGNILGVALIIWFIAITIKNLRYNI
ncbi:MAG: hypothetical protein ACRCYE_09535 [Sarcina sp.]